MPLDDRHEALFACRLCGQTVAVGPHHDHIEPDGFACARCRTEKPGASDLAQAIGRARKAQAAA
jgi:hypothetical protein